MSIFVTTRGLAFQLKPSELTAFRGQKPLDSDNGIQNVMDHSITPATPIPTTSLPKRAVRLGRHGSKRGLIRWADLT